MSFSREKYTLILLFVVFLISGCRNNVYRQWEEDLFKNYIWEKDKVVRFEPEIEDTERSYTIILGLRHIFGFSLPELPVELTIESPDGNVKSGNYSIRILDEKGRGKADCSGSLCDIEMVIEKDFRFDVPGKYLFTFSQSSEFEKLAGIMEIGLIIR
jgi:gliding motility-associated lipoprotein GldH